ncbi:MAG: tryptophan--tRNA ligase, partial [Natronosporangium sp.]
TTADPAAATTATTGSGADSTRPVRRLTGLKPTGHLHLGNLIGAIAPMVAGQTSPATSSLVAVVDLHALTVDHRPHEVRALTLEQATTLLAAGLDPDRTTLFVQSHVPEHTELHYLLECVTGYGEAHRMIQFRERMAAGGRSASGARLSLLSYPVLMAADILLHDTDEVPVGDDQAQHLELARDLATRFNTRYGDTFTVPRGVLPPVAARIRDLADPTAKMGKSTGTAAGILRLLDPPDVLRDKLRRAVTDPDRSVRYDPDGKPGVSNLLEILAACAGTEADLATLAGGFHSYRQLKEVTAEAVIGVLAPIQRRYAELTAEPGQVREILAARAARARAHAAGTVTRARRAIGLLPD